MTQSIIAHTSAPGSAAAHDLLGPARFMGCNTHRQIARAEGQFGGFHNGMAVVCILVE